MSETITENVAESIPQRKRKRRRNFDWYDLRRLVRILVTLGIGATVIFGCVLGDIWLWKLINP